MFLKIETLQFSINQLHPFYQLFSELIFYWILQNEKTLGSHRNEIKVKKI